MTEKLELPRLQRELDDFVLEVRKAEDGKTRIKLTASSTYPVDRYGTSEVLSHEPGAVRLDRAKRGAMPLLFNHNWDDPVGMVEKAAVASGKLSIDAVMFDTDRAKEIQSMVEGGLRNVSIGYQINEVTHDTKTNTYTATDWEPYEVSIVTVPADPTVGVGREAPGQKFSVRVLTAAVPKVADPPPLETKAEVPELEARITRASSISESETPNPGKSEVIMSQENAAAGASADTKIEVTRHEGPSARELEAARKRAIENLCKGNKIGDNIRDLWISSGQSVENVSDDLLKILEDRGKANPQTSAASLGLSEKETRQFSLMRAIRAVADKNWALASFEAECSREIGSRLNRAPDPNKFYIPLEVQQRSIDGRAIAARDQMRGTRAAETVGVASQGGYLVATINQSFIEVLRNRTVAFRMGARVLSGLVGNITVPRQTAAGTAYWLASESTQLTASNQAFGQMALTPKTVGAYTEISRLLLLQSSPDAEGIINADLAAVTAIAVDNGVLNGSGSGGQPTGIINTAGVTLQGSQTSLSYPGVLLAQSTLLSANVVPVAGGYVTTPTVAGLLAQRVKFTNTATPVWDGNLTDGNVAGYPAMSSMQIAASTMLYGDWSQVVVGEWGVLEIEVNPYANFQAGIIGVRALMTLDVGLRYPQAFVNLTGIT